MTGSNGAGEGRGDSVRRVEDPPFLRGTRPYTDDLRNAEALYAVFVRSGFAHARISGIDTSEAAATPGVVGVYTAADLNLEDFAAAGAPVPSPDEMRRPVLAKDVVRFIGEPVAVVVAETRGQAVDAAELVDVDFDPLDAVVDMTKALDDDAPILFPGFEKGNLAVASDPPGDDALGDAEVRVFGRFHNQRLAAVPMEPSAALAAPDPDTGGFILWTTTQWPHANRDVICAATGIDKEAAARHHDRHRRRLRRAHRDLSGAGRRRRAGARARPRRPLRRDALGDHARDAARPRAVPGRRDRRHPRRQGHGAEGPRAPGLRRLPGRRRADADADRPDVLGRLRLSEDRLLLRRGGHATRRRSAPTAAPAARRRRRSSSGRWTCSRSSWGWTRPSCAGATTSRTSRTRP